VRFPNSDAIDPKIPTSCMEDQHVKEGSVHREDVVEATPKGMVHQLLEVKWLDR
jgi:hypothetical protein